MNARKKRDKNRRKARRAAEQAWGADDINVDLAVKIIRRAVAFDPGNPALWNDQGLIMRQAEDYDRAAESFEAAICLAPDFAEAYANLADIRARQGSHVIAVSLQRQAVELGPDLARYRGQLAAYESIVGSANVRSTNTRSRLEVAPDTAELDSAPENDEFHSMFNDVLSRIQELDWSTIETELTQNGYVRLTSLLDAARCKSLRDMFDEDGLFSKTVVMNKTRFGRGVYRYFDSPNPQLVNCIRRAVYTQAVRIVNRWQTLLGRQEFFPDTWGEFRARCADAGQTTSSPLLLRYEVGGFNALHQDLRGEVFFPLQLVIILSPRRVSGGDPSGFRGGEFLFCDEPERKKSDRRAISVELGDAVLFCTRERLVQVAGVYGLKVVKHGMLRVTSGNRTAIGIPFHEFT
jgi:hypothetical protein